MNKQEQLALAEKVAREAHVGQYRRDSITPYIKHLEDTPTKKQRERYSNGILYLTT